MRTFLVLATLVGMALLAQADDAKPDKDDKKNPPQKEEKPAPSLKVGDKAPALKASAWLQGQEVKEFVPGKIYIVEFWATWCGPCVVMMPHMGEIQKEYTDKGLTIIGYTAKDPNNTQEKVTEFVKKRGPKLGYTFAYGDDRTTYDAWMTAAKQNGIPCSFVVDKEGKIVYIGHPLFLDELLPRIVAGTWKTTDVAEVEAMEKDLNNVFKALAPSAPIEEAQKTLAEFEKQRPGLARIPYLVAPKIDLLLRAKKFEEAKKMVEVTRTKAAKQEDSMMLRQLSNVLRSPAAKEEKDLLSLGVAISEEFLKISGEKDLGALYNMAEAYFFAGDKAKAKEFGQKALDIAAKESPAALQFLKKQVEKYEDKPKEDEKPQEKKPEAEALRNQILTTETQRTQRRKEE